MNAAARRYHHTWPKSPSPAKSYSLPQSSVINCANCGAPICAQNSYRTGAKYYTNVVMQNGNPTTSRTNFHNCAAKSSGQQPLPFAAINVAGIQALFDKAGQHLQYPKIRLMIPALGPSPEVPNGQPEQPIAIYRAGKNSRYSGQLMVTDGEKYGRNKFFGRIDAQGQYFKGHDLVHELVSLLKQLAEDPAGVASRYGKLTGNCCFCGLPLSDQRSTDVGYGPICAEHFELPWG